jgi:peptidoglycan-associated lipoprotein
MIRTTVARVAVSATLLALLTACGSAVKLNEPSVETRAPSPVDAASSAGNAAAADANAGKGVAQAQVSTAGKDAGAAAALEPLPAGVGRVVYFDYDSFVVRADARTVVEAHAKLLSNNGKRQMIVEGHTDERGGSEYNLALGQKRAEAVVKALTLLGANGSQLEAVSFGKERPADAGHDEQAYAKNRRAEIKDKR